LYETSCFCKSNTAFFVIPSKAGIQEKLELLDPGFRRGDDQERFLASAEASCPIKLAASAASG
jgi:hypothetical protein